MEILTTLGRTLGFSFTAGLNLYATVAVLGLASRYGWVDLPEQFRVFDNDVVIAVALVMYLIEFVADKVPWIDSMWDSVHTFIRPVGGAVIAVATVGDASPTVQGLVALLGGTVAATSHMTKAGTRAIANTSPEPFSNWALSLGEDVLVLGLGFLAIKYPLIALAVALVLLALALWFFAVLVRAARGYLSRRKPPVDGGLSSPEPGRS